MTDETWEMPDIFHWKEFYVILGIYTSGIVKYYPHELLMAGFVDEIWLKI